MKGKYKRKRTFFKKLNKASLTLPNVPTVPPSSLQAPFKAQTPAPLLPPHGSHEINKASLTLQTLPLQAASKPQTTTTRAIEIKDQYVAPLLRSENNIPLPIEDSNETIIINTTYIEQFIQLSKLHENNVKAVFN